MGERSVPMGYGCAKRSEQGELGIAGMDGVRREGLSEPPGVCVGHAKQRSATWRKAVGHLKSSGRAPRMWWSSTAWAVVEYCVGGGRALRGRWSSTAWVVVEHCVGGGRALRG